MGLEEKLPSGVLLTTVEGVATTVVCAALSAPTASSKDRRPIAR